MVSLNYMDGVKTNFNEAFFIYFLSDTDKTCTLQIKSYETQDPFFRYVYGHSSIMDPLLQNIYDVKLVPAKYLALLIPLCKF